MKNDTVADRLQWVRASVAHRLTYYPDRISDQFRMVRHLTLAHFEPNKNFILDQLTEQNKQLS